jgi:pre-mRNA-splicing helicase BRR2
MIASYYYIHYTTVEIFASSVKEKVLPQEATSLYALTSRTLQTKIKGLLEILSAATEFSHITIRHKEEKVLEKLAKHSEHRLPSGARFSDVQTKACAYGAF